MKSNSPDFVMARAARSRVSGLKYIAGAILGVVGYLGFQIHHREQALTAAREDIAKQAFGHAIERLEPYRSHPVLRSHEVRQTWVEAQCLRAVKGIKSGDVTGAQTALIAAEVEAAKDGESQQRFEAMKPDLHWEEGRYWLAHNEPTKAREAFLISRRPLDGAKELRARGYYFEDAEITARFEKDRVQVRALWQRVGDELSTALKWAPAARAYEFAGNFDASVRAYDEAGELEKARSLAQRVGSPTVVQWLRDRDRARLVATDIGVLAAQVDKGPREAVLELLRQWKSKPYFSELVAGAIPILRRSALDAIASGNTEFATSLSVAANNKEFSLWTHDQIWAAEKSALLAKLELDLREDRLSEVLARIEKLPEFPMRVEAADQLLSQLDIKRSPSRAAALYQVSGRTLEAAKMYRLAEDWTNASAMYQLLGDIDSAISVLEQGGDLAKAEELARSKGAATYQRLHDQLYRKRLAEIREAWKAQDFVRMENGLTSLAEDQRAAAARELLPEVEKRSASRVLALCYSFLSSWEKAADAYMKVGSYTDAGKMWSAAFRYEEAASCFEKAGELDLALSAAKYITNAELTEKILRKICSRDYPAAAAVLQDKLATGEVAQAMVELSKSPTLCRGELAALVSSRLDLAKYPFERAVCSVYQSNWSQAALLYAQCGYAEAAIAAWSLAGNTAQRDALRLQEFRKTRNLTAGIRLLLDHPDRTSPAWQALWSDVEREAQKMEDFSALGSLWSMRSDATSAADQLCGMAEQALASDRVERAKNIFRAILTTAPSQGSHPRYHALVTRTEKLGDRLNHAIAALPDVRESQGTNYYGQSSRFEKTMVNLVVKNPADRPLKSIIVEITYIDPAPEFYWEAMARSTEAPTIDVNALLKEVARKKPTELPKNPWDNIPTYTPANWPWTDREVATAIASAPAFYKTQMVVLDVSSNATKTFEMTTQNTIPYRRMTLSIASVQWQPLSAATPPVQTAGR